MLAEVASFGASPLHLPILQVFKTAANSTTTVPKELGNHKWKWRDPRQLHSSYLRLIYVSIFNPLLHVGQSADVHWGVREGSMDPREAKDWQPRVNQSNEEEVPVIGCSLHQPETRFLLTAVTLSANCNRLLFLNLSSNAKRWSTLPCTKWFHTSALQPALHEHKR